MASSLYSSMVKVFEESDCLYPQEAVVSAIETVAFEISQKLSEDMPVILTVMNGGLVFSGQLLPRLAFPLEIDYVHATRYGEQIVGKSLNWIAKPQIDLAGRSILIIDDILDEGNTLLEVIRFCQEQGAKDVYTAVLVDKQHDRKAQPGFKADFTGLDVEDRFIFGFGMDYKGFWRNAPGIYAVKGL